MGKLFSIKKVLSLLGIIILGALSNPVWEFVIKPFSILCYKIILNISVLGLTTLKDKIYLEIAQNFHEKSGLEVYSIILVVFITMYLFITARFIKRKFFENSEKKVLYPWQGSISYVFISIFIFGIGFFIVEYVKENYINNAITYYNQLIYIDKPFISQNDFDLYNSRFAQIKNKEDYSSIIKDLEKISLQNNLHVPDFQLTF